MYIGPWQEYSLYKSKAKASNKSLQSDIQKAILGSLDPDSAQKAIQALDPYFNKTVSRQTTLYQIDRSKMRNINKKKSKLANLLPPIDPYSKLNKRNDDTTYDYSKKMINSARNHSNTSSPSSVRSTKSEPIPERKIAEPYNQGLPKLHINTIIDQNANNPFKYKNYTGSPILRLPKLNKKPRIESHRTNLKRQRIRDKPKPAKLPGKESDSEIDKKIQHVNQMKKLYLSKLEEIHVNKSETKPVQDIIPNNLGSKQAKNTSPRQASVNDDLPYRADSIPKIRDLELTKNEFSLVSKYFVTEIESNRKIVEFSDEIEETESPKDSSEESLQLDNNLEEDSNEVKNKNSIHNIELKSSGQNGKKLGQSNSSSDLIIDSDLQNLDELYVGGIDGLLKWSTQLNLDDL